MSDAQQTKEESITLPKLMTWLRERHSYLTGLGAKETCEGCLHAYVEELQRDVARWENAHKVAMIERDHYKLIAEMNAETIKGRQEPEVYAMGSLFEGSL